MLVLVVNLFTALTFYSARCFLLPKTFPMWQWQNMKLLWCISLITHLQLSDYLIFFSMSIQRNCHHRLQSLLFNSPAHPSVFRRRRSVLFQYQPLRRHPPPQFPKRHHSDFQHQTNPRVLCQLAKASPPHQGLIHRTEPTLVRYWIDLQPGTGLMDF